VGWASSTHGLKDEEIKDEVFMEDVEYTLRERWRIMKDQLSRKDWRFFFCAFETPDRVQHLMWRHFDDTHAYHFAKQAARKISFMGREIPLSDGIPAAYRAVDEIVGDVMARVEGGALGKNTVLMVVSDHGVAPFRRGLALNNFLVEKGFMTLVPDPSGKRQSIEDLQKSGRDNYLTYVDWSKSRAYSLGLGKVYINLEGREPEGCVAPGDYEKVKEEIIGALEAFRDPETGHPVVKKVYRREEIFSGDFWREGVAAFRFSRIDGKPVEEKRRIEGFADLYLGFHPGYRVSWPTSLGGLDQGVIVANTSPWSADHVSVDPSEVPGVFLCSRKQRGGAEHGLCDIAPTVFALLGLQAPENMDGEPILLGE
jgi:hypothetical protein